MIDRHLELISRLTSTRRIFLLLLPTSEAGAESIGRLGRLEVFDASVAAVWEPRDLAQLLAAPGGMEGLEELLISELRLGDLSPCSSPRTSGDSASGRRGSATPPSRRWRG